MHDAFVAPCADTAHFTVRGDRPMGTPVMWMAAAIRAQLAERLSQLGEPDRERARNAQGARAPAQGVDGALQDERNGGRADVQELIVLSLLELDRLDEAEESLANLIEMHGWSESASRLVKSLAGRKRRG